MFTTHIPLCMKHLHQIQNIHAHRTYKHTHARECLHTHTHTRARARARTHVGWVYCKLWYVHESHANKVFIIYFRLTLLWWRIHQRLSIVDILMNIHYYIPHLYQPCNVHLAIPMHITNSTHHSNSYVNDLQFAALDRKLKLYFTVRNTVLYASTSR